VVLLETDSHLKEVMAMKSEEQVLEAPREQKPPEPTTCSCGCLGLVETPGEEQE
jgi:hypothetical protein